MIACLDAGSNPADSTNLIPNMFNINVLGFFILDICTIIVWSDVESQKDLAKKILLDNDTNLKTMYILKQPDQ